LDGASRRAIVEPPAQQQTPALSKRNLRAAKRRIRHRDASHQAAGAATRDRPARQPGSLAKARRRIEAATTAIDVDAVSTVSK
jgi:hypothetical protein